MGPKTPRFWPEMTYAVRVPLFHLPRSASCLNAVEGLFAMTYRMFRSAPGDRQRAVGASPMR